MPINDTIDIILKYIYDHSSIPPPKILKPILKELLELFSKECPFYGTDVNLIIQRDGVAMGSALGPLLANLYMGHLEQAIIDKKINKPHRYCKYVDDIFLQVYNEQEIIQLLKFTYEMNVDKIFPSLMSV